MPKRNPKRPQNFRFTDDTVRLLEIAAAQTGVTKNVYVEQALKAQFKKDDIKLPYSSPLLRLS